MSGEEGPLMLACRSMKGKGELKAYPLPFPGVGRRHLSCCVPHPSLPLKSCHASEESPSQLSGSACRSSPCEAWWIPSPTR